MLHKLSGFSNVLFFSEAKTRGRKEGVVEETVLVFHKQKLKE